MSNDTERMNIIEAIKSGKPFRRSTVRTKYAPNKEPEEYKVWKWMVANSEPLGLQFRNIDDAGNVDMKSQCFLNASDVIAEDWEIKQ